jgi:predicted permease
MKPLLENLSRDLRHTFRILRRDAGFTAFAILIIGLGIGASSTVFSVVNTLLLRPLPFRDPARLVWITNRDVAGMSGQTTQVDHMLDLGKYNRSFEAVTGYFAFYGVGDNVLGDSARPERLSGVPVAGNFFEVLGIQPQIGRLFTPEECTWAGRHAVLLSHGLWSRRFNSDPAITGRKILLNGEPYTVTGVMPASFDFASVFAPGSHFDLYFPFPLVPETNRWGNTMAMIGRLKPGATAAGAQAEVAALGRRFTAEHPGDRNSFEGFIKPLSDQVSGRMRLALWVLVGSIGAVMLIVCANLSNLLLARAAGRSKEMAIRTALGAGRRQLLAQMLTEALVLSGSGALLGLILAMLATKGLAHLDAVSIPLLSSVRTDSASLAFILAMAILTGIVFGLAPALQSFGTQVQESLKDSSRGSTAGRGRRWVRNALVVSEVAFACVLLVAAGLLIRSLFRVLDVNLGFRPEQTATIRVDPDNRQYDTLDKQNAYFDEVLRRVRQVPGVQAAGITDALPLGRNRTWGAGAKGKTYERGKYPSVYVRIATDGYASAMGIPLRAGRDISERDTPATEQVIVINETMARALFPGQNPIGQVLTRPCGERRIVGVVGDVRHLALEQDSGNEMYIPMRQCGDQSSADLVIRTTLPPAQFSAAIREVLKPIAPNLPANDFRTLQSLVDKSVSPRRFIVFLLAGFALFALALASLGIYGVISYSVSQRTQEIGIRMALGASARDVQTRIVAQTLGLAVTGLALGAAASAALARTLKGLLYEVTAGDPATFAAVVVVLGTVAVVAGYLPARRASRIDPVIALRAD